MSEKVKAFYKKLPERYRKAIEMEAVYADIGNIERITLTVIGATAATVLVSILLLPYSILVKSIILLIGLTTAPPVIPYVMVSIAAEKRKKEMENVLPDALLLISANLKSGLSIEKAFLLSARDEFGPLAEELRQTAMEMFGGKPVQEALDDMEYRIKSELFSETLKLLVDGLESGGNTARLLESSAEDIRKSLELQEEINSNIRMYVIFILMAAVVGAPLLFSISVYMSSTTANMWEDVNLQKMSEMQSSGSGFSMSFQKPQVNTAFFEQFSIMAIIAINFFAGLIISEIKNANIKEGAKYIPILIVVSVTLFFLIKGAIGGLVGGFV
ncbi:MAG: type II secretion system F family protein [Candidatus Aenigmatarchaeota archaeon]